MSMSDDPYNLARFVLAQRQIFDKALGELKRGRKQSHWMWFIFPQIHGLGSSPESVEFAVKSLGEAQSYLAASCPRKTPVRMRRGSTRS